MLACVGIDVDIDVLDARLKLLVAILGPPSIFAGRQQTNIRDKKTAPTGQMAAFAVAGGLKDEQFFAPVAMAENMRVSFPLPHIDREGDLVLLPDGGETGAVYGGCHGFSVRKRAEESPVPSRRYQSFAARRTRFLAIKPEMA